MTSFLVCIAKPKRHMPISIANLSMINEIDRSFCCAAQPKTILPWKGTAFSLILSLLFARNSVWGIKMPSENQIVKLVYLWFVLFASKWNHQFKAYCGNRSLSWLYLCVRSPFFSLLLDAARSGDKYETSSTNIGYSKFMKLKIRTVGPGDYGSYRCVAKNSLGETDGLIKLEGSSLIKLVFL